MITSSQIGKNGRLGNQIFQLSALYSVNFLRGMQVKIPTDQQLSSTFNLNGIEIGDSTESEFLFEERTNEFDPAIFLVPDRTDIRGYFQSGKYFNHVSDNIRKILEFKKEVREQAVEKISKISGPVCAIHFRRGDYLNLSHFHKNLDAEYYNQALTVVNSNIRSVKFVAFSDDYEWCRNSMPESFVVDDSSQEVALCMMSMCQIHIMANSSFSWWGAWLSGSGAVVSPKQWFASSGPRSWNDIYEPGWVVV